MLIRASETKEECKRLHHFCNLVYSADPVISRGSSTVTFASVEVRIECIEHCLGMLLQYNHFLDSQYVKPSNRYLIVSYRTYHMTRAILLAQRLPRARALTDSPRTQLASGPRLSHCPVEPADFVVCVEPDLQRQQPPTTYIPREYPRAALFLSLDIFLLNR